MKPSGPGSFYGWWSVITFLIVSMGIGLYTFSLSTGVCFGKLYLPRKSSISPF